MKDLLSVIERQEKELKLSVKSINKNQVEIEQLRSSLRESERTVRLLGELAKKSLTNGEELAKLIGRKPSDGGNNSFFSGNN